MTVHQSWLRTLLRPLAPVFMEVATLSLFINLLALAVPVFVLQVYDRVIFHAGVSTLQGLVIGMTFVVVFDFTLRQSRARILQSIALNVDAKISKKLFDQIMSLPLRTLEGQSAPQWLSLFRDVDTLRNVVSGASALLICDLPFLLLFFGLIWIIAAPVAWVLMVLLPIYALVAWQSARSLSMRGNSERDSLGSRDELLAEILAGRATVKALALDHALAPLWEARATHAIEQSLARGVRADGYGNVASLLNVVTTVSMTSMGALAILDHRMTIGALIAANMLSGRLLGPLTQLVGNWRTFAHCRHAVAKLSRTFAAATERRSTAVQLPRPKGRITLEAVRFTYDGAASPALDGMTTVFAPGSVTGIVGRNGSGKSTLLKVVLGLYPPDIGRVLLDGADLLQISRSDLATWVGYIPQECVLFSGTIRDNIAFRQTNVSDEAILEAAMIAGVHSFVIDLPEGYGSRIGEGGRLLSAGQRQRLTLARALVGNPPVILFDEPSSHLDRQSEQELRNTLISLGCDRTVIIVTHSPMLLSATSTLLVLEKGQIALAGPTEELLPRIVGAGGERPTSHPMTNVSRLPTTHGLDSNIGAAKRP